MISKRSEIKNLILKYSLIFLTLVTTSLLLFQGRACAQEIAKGEVTNVSVAHKTVFTDLTSSHLKVGDIIEIFNNTRFLAYMEVIETSDVFSKLGFLQKYGLATNQSDFENITIGDKVIKVIQGDAAQRPEALLTAVSLLEEENKSLNERLPLMISEKNKLQTEVKQLKEKISVLEKNLKTINALLDEKISVYESY